MNGVHLMAAAGVIGAGLVGGAVLVRPAPVEDGSGRAARSAVAALESRVASLEEDLAQANRERAAAERQIADAMSAAIEARREVERLRGQTEDILLALNGGAEKGAKLASKDASKKPADADAPALGTTTGSLDTDPRLAAAPASPPDAVAPQDVEVVKKALAEIRKAEDEQQQAQREARRQELQARRLKDLTARLNLTEHQAGTIQTIWDETQAKRTLLFQAMRDGGGAPSPDMREQMQATRAEEQQKIQALLSPAQYADMQKMQEEEQAARRQFGGGFGGPGGEMSVAPPPPR